MAQALVPHGTTIDPVLAVLGTIVDQALVAPGTTIDPVSAVHGTIVDQALAAPGITTAQASVCPGVIIMAAAGAGEIKGSTPPVSSVLPATTDLPTVIYDFLCRPA